MTVKHTSPMSAEDIGARTAALTSERDEFDARRLAAAESRYVYAQRIDPVITSEEPAPQSTPPSSSTMESPAYPSVDLNAIMASLSLLSASQKDAVCKQLGCSTKKAHKMRCLVEVLVALACIVLIVVIARRSRTPE
jgi:hypothetical protein